jgi:hypothetical protein
LFCNNYHLIAADAHVNPDPKEANMRISPLDTFPLLTASANAIGIVPAVAEAINKGKVSRGDILMLASFGSGFTWASAAIKW